MNGKIAVVLNRRIVWLQLIHVADWGQNRHIFSDRTQMRGINPVTFISCQRNIPDNTCLILHYLFNLCAQWPKRRQGEKITWHFSKGRQPTSNTMRVVLFLCLLLQTSKPPHHHFSFLLLLSIVFTRCIWTERSSLLLLWDYKNRMFRHFIWWINTYNLQPLHMGIIQVLPASESLPEMII